VTGPKAIGQFAAVLLDLDGTLVSSVAAVERSWMRWFAEYDLPPVDMLEIHGVPAHVTVDRLLADRTAADRAAARRRIDELELADREVDVLPGAREVLEELGPAGRCAIVTSSSAELATVKLAATGLPHPPMVAADDVLHGKPHPEPYLAGARLLGVDPTLCLVVEDAPAGLAAGRAAGASTLGLRTTVTDPDADHVVADLGEVTVTATASGVTVMKTIG
jgi:mannitol-1-/sugar-/sorbitol-6-phosphatase